MTITRRYHHGLEEDQLQARAHLYRCKPLLLQAEEDKVVVAIRKMLDRLSHQNPDKIHGQNMFLAEKCAELAFESADLEASERNELRKDLVRDHGEMYKLLHPLTRHE